MQWVKRSNYARTFGEWFSFTAHQQGELIAMLDVDLKHDLKLQKEIDEMKAKREGL
ncbi:MAG: hypothetical protein FWB96_01195 [Defluviitaleaceae bacterium]|nr:hypothetical protein [Defluviitaleaceae bacterium]MCL2261692.1 hypothetical protein [Defluviitaleaceae bacterium]